MSAAATVLPPGPRWDEIEVGLQLATEERLLDWHDVVLQISGSQDWHRIHFDHEYALGAGHREVFFNTGWTSAMLSKILTDWCGATGWVSELTFEMRKMICPGDTVTTKATVTRKHSDAGQRSIELDVWLETDRDGIATRGRAVVTLP